MATLPLQKPWSEALWKEAVRGTPSFLKSNYDSHKIFISFNVLLSQKFLSQNPNHVLLLMMMLFSSHYISFFYLFILVGG